MKKVLFATTILGILLMVPVLASAQVTSSGTMAVTATVDPSISLTFVTDASGISLTGSGTNAATMALGTVKAYGGSVPSNVTKSVNGVTDWSLATPFDVRVEKANTSSADYTLTGQLASADATRTWKIGSNTLSDTAASTLTSTGSYNTNVSHTFTLTIPHSASSGAVSNTINFTATAN